MLLSMCFALFLGEKMAVDFSCRVLSYNLKYVFEEMKVS